MVLLIINPKSVDIKTQKCYKCGKIGHLKSECRSTTKQKPAPNARAQYVTTTNESSALQDPEDILVDSIFNVGMSPIRVHFSVHNDQKINLFFSVC